MNGNEARVMWLRDNIILEQKRKSNQYRNQKKYQRLGYLFLALIPISVFFVLSIKFDISNLDIDNANIYSDYQNSFFGWVHGGLLVLFIYLGLKYLGRANSLEAEMNYQIENELYTTSHEALDGDTTIINDLIKDYYVKLSDGELEECFRKNVQNGLKGSHVQNLHHLALHEVLLGRFGFSPYFIEEYDFNEKTIALRSGRLPTMQGNKSLDD